MTKEILTSENLIEIYDNLNKFAKHHQNIGGQKAHKLIKSELIDKDKIRDGSENMKRWYEGYDAAMKQVLSLLYQTFVP